MFSFEFHKKGIPKGIPSSLKRYVNKSVAIQEMMRSKLPQNLIDRKPDTW